MPGYPAWTRREFLRRLSGAMAVPALLAACARSEASDEAATSVPTQTSAATPLPTPTPVPSASPIPDLGLVDTVDRGSIDEVRIEDLNEFGHYDEVRVAEDGTRHLIPLQAVEWGGVAKDGIPSIDAPSYVGPDRWSQMVYDPDGLVVGVEVDGKYRAYPLQILIWHEIINETFNGKHLLVTY